MLNRCSMRQSSTSQSALRTSLGPVSKIYEQQEVLPVGSLGPEISVTSSCKYTMLQSVI